MAHCGKMLPSIDPGSGIATEGGRLHELRQVFRTPLSLDLLGQELTPGSGCSSRATACCVNGCMQSPLVPPYV